jgi:hypothetical protein
MHDLSRTREAVMPTWVDSNLVTHWNDDISNEKKPTALPRNAALRAIFKDNAVFPIDGLAAKMIKSLPCNPDVNLSRLGNEVGQPVNPSLSFFKAEDEK